MDRYPTTTNPLLDKMVKCVHKNCTKRSKVWSLYCEDHEPELHSHDTVTQPLEDNNVES